MRRVRSVLSSLPKYLLWIVLSTMFWLWIFTIITDTSAEKKITLYADVASVEDPGLAVRLEEDLPEGIKMVKAHSFSYLMFGDAEIANGDIYIIRASDVEAYRESFMPLPEGFTDDAEKLLYLDGIPYGIRIYDAGTAAGAAQTYITYAGPSHPAEDWYLLFGAGSVHCGKQDRAALDIAGVLLTLP